MSLRNGSWVYVFVIVALFGCVRTTQHEPDGAAPAQQDAAEKAACAAGGDAAAPSETDAARPMQDAAPPAHDASDIVASDAATSGDTDSSLVAVQDAAPDATDDAGTDAATEDAATEDAATEDASVTPDPECLAPSPQWIWTYGAKDVDRVHDVAVDAHGDVWLVGEQAIPGQPSIHYGGNGTSFIRKLSPSGDVLWQQVLQGTSGSSSTALSIAIDRDGDAWISGRLHGQLELGTLSIASHPTLGSSYVLRVDSVTGAITFARALDGINATDIAADPLGATHAALVLGWFEDTIACPGQPNDTCVSQGMQDVLVARVSSDASPLQVFAYGGPGIAQPSALDVAPDGSMLVVGISVGVQDFGGGSQPIVSGDNDAVGFVASLSRAPFTFEPVTQWVTVLPVCATKSTVIANDVARSPDGSDVIVAGEAVGCMQVGDTTFDNLGHEAFVAHLDGASGKATHAELIQGGSRTKPKMSTSVAAKPDGTFVLAGLVEGDAAFGDLGMLPALGPWDLFVADVDANAKLVAAKRYGAPSGSNGVGALSYPRVASALAPNSFVVGGILFGTLEWKAGETVTAVDSWDAVAVGFGCAEDTD